MNELSLPTTRHQPPVAYKYLLIFTLGYFIALAISSIFIYRASPGPAAQELLGVGLGAWESETGITFLSGRRLACQKVDDIAPFTSKCQIEIAGKLLTIHALQNKTPTNFQLLGDCAAFYDGVEWPCKIGSRHVQVHWFAYIDAPLGLDNTQMAALRQRYFFENLPEDPFILGSLAVAVVTALLSSLNVIVYFWHKAEIKFFLWLTAVPIAIVTFFGTAYTAVLITNGFWD